MVVSGGNGGTAGAANAAGAAVGGGFGVRVTVDLKC